MLITCLGPPSAFTQWSMYLIRIMTDVVLREVDYLTAATVEDMRKAWLGRKCPHILFFSDCPTRPLVEMLMRTRAPALLLLEDPDDITGFVVRERDLTPLWAARLTGQCLTALSDFLYEEHVAVLTRSEEMTFEDFFFGIADFFGLELSSGALDVILRRIAPPRRPTREQPMEAFLLEQWQHARPKGRGLQDLSPFDRAAVATVHGGLRELMRGRGVEEFGWTPVFFIPGGRPEAILDGPIELVGPARCLVYGPYLNLPYGQWQARMTIIVSGNRSGNRLEIDIYAADLIVNKVFLLPESGRFVAVANFPVSDPRDAIQMRLMLKEGAIDGTLALEGVTVVRLENTPLSHAS